VTDKNLFFAFSNPVTGKEQEFNEWYDQVHIPELMAIPGISSAQRFSAHRAEGDPAHTHGYLTIYEIEGDPAEVMGRIGKAAAAGELNMGDSLDFASAVTSFWIPCGPKVEA
jgi:hypothetical protein